MKSSGQRQVTTSNETGKTPRDKKVWIESIGEMSYYDEIEIEDMHFNPANDSFYYPCPCGDLFQIALDDLRDGEEVATCPSCSLLIRVVYDIESLDECVEKARLKPFPFEGKR
eukprot:ANDGO_01873.mRNA.1 Diphthamide biosynthesis protein 3